jgi:hypothetical protein
VASERLEFVELFLQAGADLSALADLNAVRELAVSRGYPWLAERCRLAAEEKKRQEEEGGCYSGWYGEDGAWYSAEQWAEWKADHEGARGGLEAATEGAPSGGAAAGSHDSDIGVSAGGQREEAGAEARDAEKAEADFAEALARSRAEAGELPLSRDGVTLFRLTRNHRSSEVVNLLMDPEGELAHLHKRMRDAGCDVAPDWAGGAKLFVPFTPEQLDDLDAMGLELEGHHILALSSDKRAIEEALTPVRRKKRPRVSVKHSPDLGPRASADASSSGAQDAPTGGSGGSTSIENLVNDAVLEVVHAIRTDSSLGYPEYRPADLRGAGPM